MDRTSRVLSVGSLAAAGGAAGGYAGEYQEFHQHQQLPPQQQEEGGGLRVSRSAVNLGGGEFLGTGQHGGHGHGHHGGRPRKASYGGGAEAGFGPGGESGGSTFDDILKGMDGNGKKAKKKLFF